MSHWLCWLFRLVHLGHWESSFLAHRWNKGTCIRILCCIADDRFMIRNLHRCRLCVQAGLRWLKDWEAYFQKGLVVKHPLFYELHTLNKIRICIWVFCDLPPGLVVLLHQFAVLIQSRGLSPPLNRCQCTHTTTIWDWMDLTHCLCL